MHTKTSRNTKQTIAMTLLLWCSVNMAKTADEALINIMKHNHSNRIAIVGTTAIFPPLGLLMSSKIPCDEDETSIIDKIDETLQQGANINYQETMYDCDEKTQRCPDIYSKYTALMYAVYEGLPSVVAFLIEKGADTNLKDRSGWNAYALAEFYYDRYKNYYMRNGTQKLTETSTQKDKEDESCQPKKYMNRYNQIACILKPLTQNHKIPSSWFSNYKGDTRAPCPGD